MSKQKLEMVRTPKGVASYPWLTKEDPEYGGYKVSLKLDAEDATPVIEKIEAAMEQARTLVPNGKKPKENLPYKVEDDGTVTVKFKSNYAPMVVDAETNRVPSSVNILGGSIIKVNGELNPYFVPTTGVGVSIYIKAVQVLKLGEGSGSGFDKTEGYTVNSSEEEPSFQNETDSHDEEDF